jgi:hypothetical protein
MPSATLVVDDALDLFATLGELELQALGLQIELQRTGELPHGFASSTSQSTNCARAW